MKARHLSLAVLPVLITSCTTTTAYRQKNGSLTVSRVGLNSAPTSYWITGAHPGKITTAEDLAVFEKYAHKSLPARPVKCSGFIDATDAKRIEIRLAQKNGNRFDQPWMNGRHKLVDESAPKPFYHWLIP